MQDESYKKKPGRALIIGGGIAGLLSAKVLSSFFEEVTIIERDILENGIGSRKGVPQSTQPHILLTKGYRILKDFFPDFDKDLLASGAIPIDWGKEFYCFMFGGWIALHDQDTDINSFSCTRPLLEEIIRGYIKKISNVKVFAPYRVQELIGNTEIISGVKCVKVGDKNDQRTICADLILDTSGRSTNALKWLAKLRIPYPETDIVDAGLGYATQRYQIPDDWDKPWKVMLASHDPPNNKRLGYIARIENNEFIATLGGYEKDYPPLTQTDFINYAKRLPISDFYDMVSRATPSSEIKSHRATANRFHRYENLEDMPLGFVALGDSVCSLCPAYGQGLTVSAISALTLHDYLNHQLLNEKTLRPLEFQEKLAKQIETSWKRATGFDLRFEGVTADMTPTLGDKLFMKYFQKLIRMSHTDSSVSVRLTRISHMIDSPLNLFHPQILRKI